MANELSGIVRAVQRMAWKKNRYKTSALNAAKKRGTLAAERGVGGSAGEDCCNQNMKGSTNDGSNVTDTGGLIPDDYDFGDHLESLTGLTDCATGDPVTVNFSGTFTPPEGWDSLDQGPVDPSWLEGFYWDCEELAAEGFGATPYLALESHVEQIYGAAATDYYLVDQVSSSLWTGRIHYTVNGNPASTLVSIRREACTASSPDYACEVTSDDFRLTEWPADSVPQIGLIDGQFVSYKADPDGGAYKYPTNTLQLCDGNGKAVKVAADKFGGHLVIPVDPVTGEPIDGATATRYDQNGNVLKSGGTLDAAEAERYILPPP